MRTAKDIMTRDVVTVTPDTDVNAAAKILLEKDFNGLPVLDEQGKLVGVLCQSDLVVQQREFPLPSFFTLLGGFVALTSLSQLQRAVDKMAATKVSQAMTADPISVTPDTPVNKLADLMVDNKYHTIPVLEDDKLVGVVGKKDILRLLASSGE
ncbi:CBS domain-containing protein [Desulfonatronum thioautotrophicum]|uniref:CBS domain-containing protein n=1 Tax=Desulfonatronum thioautotrophicum TaxID=617001 RepID=UPI0005EBF3CB|nr:CBS domain-containing protein [Desulfonatronum thioautotrophicum]